MQRDATEIMKWLQLFYLFVVGIRTICIRKCFTSCLRSLVRKTETSSLVTNIGNNYYLFYYIYYYYNFLRISGHDHYDEPHVARVISLRQFANQLSTQKQYNAYRAGAHCPYVANRKICDLVPTHHQYSSIKV